MVRVSTLLFLITIQFYSASCQNLTFEVYQFNSIFLNEDIQVNFGAASPISQLRTSISPSIGVRMSKTFKSAIKFGVDLEFLKIRNRLSTNIDWTRYNYNSSIPSTTIGTDFNSICIGLDIGYVLSSKNNSCLEIIFSNMLQNRLGPNPSDFDWRVSSNGADLNPINIRQLARAPMGLFHRLYLKHSATIANNYNLGFTLGASWGLKNLGSNVWPWRIEYYFPDQTLLQRELIQDSRFGLFFGLNYSLQMNAK